MPPPATSVPCRFDGGKPRTVCPGDSLAMYPGGEAMLVQLVEKDGHAPAARVR